MPFYSPLRYPGGKSKLYGHIRDLIIENNLSDLSYIEPYAGGAAVALALAFNNVVKDVLINDIDSGIYAFWYSVLNHTEYMLKKINDSPLTIEEWRKQKHIYKHGEDYSIQEYGFATFFLNRTNRSGVISGGMIGGVNQTGKWKLDARFNRKNLKERIKKIASHAHRISISNHDTCELLKKRNYNNNMFIFLDPPYYVKGKELYLNFYTHEDHIKLEKIISNLNCNWLVSYDNVSQINTIYSKYRSIPITLAYSAGMNRVGKEVLFYSDNLTIPNYC